MSAAGTKLPIHNVRALAALGRKADITIADIAVQVNSSVEDSDARRLQTVMERVLDHHSRF